MLIQGKITHQLSVDSPSNLDALTFGLNLCLRLLTHPNSAITIAACAACRTVCKGPFHLTWLCKRFSQRPKGGECQGLDKVPPVCLMGPARRKERQGKGVEGESSPKECLLNTGGRVMGPLPILKSIKQFLSCPKIIYQYQPCSSQSNLTNLCKQAAFIKPLCFWLLQGAKYEQRISAQVEETQRVVTLICLLKLSIHLHLHFDADLCKYSTHTAWYKIRRRKSIQVPIKIKFCI
uniref:Uncharacterized protein n=1 Tax=Dicentrarchus labrax TaxID=13489 RepID=E6ZG58_DICLA|nr:Uncharacterized protein [Dicentrarchus labrax]